MGGEEGQAVVEDVAEEDLLEDRAVVDREHAVDRAAADVQEAHAGRELVGQGERLGLCQRAAVQRAAVVRAGEGEPGERGSAVDGAQPVGSRRDGERAGLGRGRPEAAWR